MKSKTIRFFSLFVTLAVLISTMQVTLAVIAADLQTDEIIFDSTSNESGEILEAADTTPYETVAYVVGEDESLRKENEKHFRMSDGSYIAAVYPEAVHYLDNGEWEEIDNTLVQTEGGYRNASNDFTVMFSSDNSSTELYTITYGEHSVAMYYRPYSSGNTSLYALRPADTKHITVNETDENCEVFNVNSTADSVKEYRENNPGATEEQISEVVKAQNDENRRQRDYALQPKKLDSSLEFADILGNVDIEYAVTPSSVKENIILESASDGNVFEFILETDLEAVLNDDGTLDLMDDEELIFTMPAPYMYDANGEVSYDVQYSVSSVSSGILLTVTADDEWLDSEDRAFPVTIDPTVSTHKTLSSDWNIITEHISDSNMTAFNQGAESWCMGYDASAGNYYAYLKVNALPQIPYNCTYTGAAVHFWLDTYENAGTSRMIISAKAAIAGNWRNQFINGTANTNPIIDHVVVSDSKENSWISFDVTNVANDWRRDDTTNTGLIFTATTSSGSAMTSSKYGKACFRGYNNTSTSTVARPFFVLSYRNTVGIESYYSYHTVSADRAGVAAVNEYTGELTLVRDVGASISYVYNSPYGDRVFTADNVYNTVDYSNMKSAKGWRLSLQQSVVEKTFTEYNGASVVSKTSYIYTDGDGTEHYCYDYDGDNVFTDEDGLGLELEKEGSTYTMTDDKDNRMIFIYGYLSQIIDRNGNKTVLLYDTDTYSASGTAWQPKSSTANGKNQLRKVIYIPDGKDAITAATLVYDSTSKYLASVTDRAGMKTTFNVNSEGLLLTITDSDNMESRYRYKESPYRLIAAYDAESEYGLAFTYHTNDGDAIQKYSDFIAELDEEFHTQIENTISTHPHDVLECSGATAAWEEVLSVYSVKTTTDPDDAAEVASIDDGKKAIIREVFWLMNTINARTESRTETVVTQNYDSRGNVVETTTNVTKVYLIITVTHKTATEMADHYGFSEDQREQLAELLNEENRGMWDAVLAGVR